MDETGVLNDERNGLPEARYSIIEPITLKSPFWQVFELHRTRAHAFLLDSANPIKGLGRFSFMGSRPSRVLRARRRKESPHFLADVEIIDPLDADGQPRETPRIIRRVSDPFEVLREQLAARGAMCEANSGRPTPFLSGAVGYFGYEAAHFLEHRPDQSRDSLSLPEIEFGFYDCVLAHCHETGVSYLSTVGRGRDSRSARRAAERLRDDWIVKLLKFQPVTLAPFADPPPEIHLDLRSPFDQKSYEAAVLRCKEHILAGDLFEVCLTRGISAPFEGEPWHLYQALRQVSPAPFSCYLGFPEVQIASSSMERFLRLGDDRVAESRPIKGTRPRGATPEEDQALRRRLRTSVKDRAENLMIVDLVRNDLGRVCEPGTIHVPELMVVEPYATVFQLVSTVRGRLRDDRDGLDLIRACFPGGSMTGAPKIEALKVIDRLEPEKRGIYSGSIGYLDDSGALDFNIVIRTLIIHQGRCRFNVGGAIVADSDPDDEYLETVAKARALITALALAATAP